MKRIIRDAADSLSAAASLGSTIGSWMQFLTILISVEYMALVRLSNAAPSSMDEAYKYAVSHTSSRPDFEFVLMEVFETDSA